MDAEAATAEVFESFESTPAPPPRSLKILRPEDEGNGDNMREGSPPRANDLIDATHAMLLAQTSFTKTSEALAVQHAESMSALAKAAEPKPNGNRTTIIAALILGMLPWAFNAVWWTRGTERDTNSMVQRHEERLQKMEGENGNLRTWNEKLRNNMAAYGWLIDNEGNVSRIEETVKPKRR